MSFGRENECRGAKLGFDCGCECHLTGPACDGCWFAVPLKRMTPVLNGHCTKCLRLEDECRDPKDCTRYAGLYT